jgi:CO/xanthine dehydrogenase FAD-binding subunit
VRIALGSVGVTPIRATQAEAVLRGQPVKLEALREAGETAKGEVDPISDLRGSAGYKKEMVGVFVRRALEKALGELRKAARAVARSKPKPKAKKTVSRRKGRK